MTDYRQRVREYYDAVDDGRIEDLLDLFTDDVVYDRPGHDRIEGEAELETFYREERPLADGSHDVHDVIVDGDRAAVRGTFTGVQGGDRVELEFADVHYFGDDGRIEERHTYTDRDTV